MQHMCLVLVGNDHDIYVISKIIFELGQEFHMTNLMVNFHIYNSFAQVQQCYFHAVVSIEISQLDHQISVVVTPFGIVIAR